MNREQLEHIIRAAGTLLGEDGVIIVGSQAILGTYPDGLPKRCVASLEVDVMAREDPDGTKALRINGAIGELTRFDESFGYYAEGVELGLCRFPQGWNERLVGVNTPSTNGVTGWCVEPHDLCISKLVAGREKDLDYVRCVVQSGHVLPEILLERAMETELSPGERKLVVESIRSLRRPGRRSAFRRALRDVVDDQ